MRSDTQNSTVRDQRDERAKRCEKKLEKLLKRELSSDEIERAEMRLSAARKDLKDVRLGKNGAVSNKQWRACTAILATKGSVHWREEIGKSFKR